MTYFLASDRSYYLLPIETSIVDVHAGKYLGAVGRVTDPPLLRAGQIGDVKYTGTSRTSER